MRVVALGDVVLAIGLKAYALDGARRRTEKLNHS